VELERAARATLGRGLGVDVTGPSVLYGLDSTENWDKDREYSRPVLWWNCKKKWYDFLPWRYSAPLAAHPRRFSLGRH